MTPQVKTNMGSAIRSLIDNISDEDEDQSTFDIAKRRLHKVRILGNTAQYRTPSEDTEYMENRKWFNENGMTLDSNNGTWHALNRKKQIVLKAGCFWDMTTKYTNKFFWIETPLTHIEKGDAS